MPPPRIPLGRSQPGDDEPTRASVDDPLAIAEAVHAALDDDSTPPDWSASFAHTDGNARPCGRRSRPWPGRWPAVTLTMARFADRIRRLADTLGELQARVDRAVTAEVRRAVGEAARNLVAAALGEQPTPPSPANIQLAR